MSLRLSRRAKRILRRHARKPSVVPLNLVSMIDVFTVLVFFLLVTTASVDNLRNPRELALPTSLSLDQPPTAAPVINAVLPTSRSAIAAPLRESWPHRIARWRRV